MFYVKITGLIILICCGTLIGFYYSEKLKQRGCFWENFLSLIVYLRTEMRYNSTPIDKIFDKFSSFENNSLLLRNCLKNYRRLVNSGFFYEKAWRESFSIIEKNFCNHEEFLSIVNFGKNLGKTDFDGQLKHLEYYFKIFTMYFENSKEEFKVKGRLYRILGVSAGFLLAVVFL